MIASFGVYVCHAAFKNYRLREFIGLTSKEPELIIKGALQYVRHPLYSGLILISLGFFLFSPSLSAAISVGSIWLYLVVGIRLEEKKLVEEFGDDYLKYKKSTPAIIPKLF
jgi:protein-S-isoprenylcysteine O-methyltransferase Ste14